MPSIRLLIPQLRLTLSARSLAVTAAVAIALLAIACGGDDPTPTQPPTSTPVAERATEAPESPTATSVPAQPAESNGTVTIGSVVPSTGDLGVFGPDMTAAIDVAIDAVNAAGGVNGKQIEVIHRDSGTSEQLGADAANALINVDGAVGIIGAMSSGVSLSVARSATIQNGIVQISPASSSPALTALDDNDFVFRTNVSDALQGGITADIATELGFTSIATTYINNAYGEGLTRVFTEGFEGNGGTVTAQIGHESGQVSYLSELQRTADDNPDALVVIAYPETASILLRESVEGGFFDNYIFVDGVHSQSIFDAVSSPTIEGSYGTVAGAPESQARRDYVDLFRQETGGESDNPYPGFAFDAAAIMALAIEHADSEDPSDIRDSIRAVANPPGSSVGPKDLARALELIRNGEDVNYVGAGGDQDFDEFGDVINTVQLWRIKDGKIEDLDIYLKPGDPIELPDDATGMSDSQSSDSDASAATSTTQFQVGEGSEAIFKVDETLRGVDVVVAMQTDSLSGTVDLSGASANIEIDLHALTSDQARRDRYVRERMFPNYPVTTVQFSGLGDVPSDFTSSGQEFSTNIPASVTVNGTTVDLDFDITARVDSGTELVALGNAAFVWSDFGMTAPVSNFFTVEDDVTVEILIRASAIQ